MFKDMSELAENKLLLLYIFCEIGMPVSNSHITQIILENNLINYFSLQQYLSELIDSGFINIKKHDKQHFLNITENGMDTLKFFMNRISPKKKEIVDDYMKKHFGNIRKQLETIAEFEPYSDNRYEVILRIASGNDVPMEIKLISESKDGAKKICNNWKDNSKGLYEEIIKLLNN
jgi:predicted transcriptional regulator